MEYTIEEQEKIARAAEKKYYEYTYSYLRHNPQLGVSERTSTIIASTDKEAVRLAKKACENTVYGYNSFGGIVSKSAQLDFNKDYYLETERKRNRYGQITGLKIVARKLWK